MESMMFCVLLVPTLAAKYTGLGVAVTAGVGPEYPAIVKLEPPETEVTELKVFPVRSVTFTVPSLTVTVVEDPSVSMTTSVPRMPTAALGVVTSRASQGSKTSESSEHRFVSGVTFAHSLPANIFKKRVAETFPNSWIRLLE
jgi:hypothetical protein